MIKLVPLLLGLLLVTRARQPEPKAALSEFDSGLLWKFVEVEVNSGEIYSGQIIGVYNEAKFMWNPTEFSTISIFSCLDSAVPLSQFSTAPGAANAVYSLSSHDILRISLGAQPAEASEYRAYMRAHGHVFSHVPVDTEVWISQGWAGYHLWEDGRSNYAWDMGALNSNMMSYSNYGTHNTDYEVWGKTVVLPMSGRVVTVVRHEVDNDPDLNSAVEMEDHQSGGDVDLEERPHNMVEVEVGGAGSPFLLRLLHLRHNTVPSDIAVGDSLTAGTAVGEVGNSGTTYVPHLHAVFGYTDGSGRFWSVPVDWADVQHRIMLPYPHGYQYASYHHHEYLYPEPGYCVTK